MCSSEVVKMVVHVSHQIFKIYEKEIGTFEEEKAPSLKEIEKAVSRNTMTDMSRLCSKLLWYVPSFILHRKRKCVFSLSPGFSLRSTP